MRKLIAIVKAFTGDQVAIGEAELLHVLMKHQFSFHSALKLTEKILMNPSDVFTERLEKFKSNLYFYRKIGTRYFIVVVKQNPEGNYFSSFYTTGSKIRSIHADLRRIK